MNQQAETHFEVGTILELTPERVAHGGALVARVDERVIFVRHGILGERARAIITGQGPKARFYFADVIDPLEPANSRVEHPWPLADSPARYAQGKLPVGGMEFGHLSAATQREYKKAVVTEQLVRLGKFEADQPALEQLEVLELENQLSWRTRMHYGIDQLGRIMMHPHQTTEPVLVDQVPLAHEAINALELSKLDLRGVKRLDVAVSSTGHRLLVFTTATDPASAASAIEPQCLAAWGDLEKAKISLVFTAERRGGRRRGTRPADVRLGAGYLVERLATEQGLLSWTVSAGGFWQIHRDAPSALAQLVKDFAQVQPGQAVYDLYGGAGFFAGLLAPETGADGFVVSVEGSPMTSRDARANLAVGGSARTAASAETEIETVKADVGAYLAKILPLVKGGDYRRPDLVVLDPSREGSGKSVMEQIDQLDPARIVYVACDPAALGRDAGTLRELGWHLERVTALDMYPGTHHVETIALFTKKLGTKKLGTKKLSTVK